MAGEDHFANPHRCEVEVAGPGDGVTFGERAVLPGPLRGPYSRLVETSSVRLIALSDRPIARRAFVFKCVFDVSLAVLALVILSPLLLFCAIGVKLTSPGPLLFRQTRIGYKGHEFDIFKFRTMHHGGCRRNKPTVRNDRRIFGFGQFLRRLSLDELPQLINVVKGEMSLVGPRPHMLGQEVEGCDFFEAVNKYAGRHRVRPGITGWAQVNGLRGPADTIEQIQNRVVHDLYYIDHWSMGFDIVILIRTVVGGFRGKNAF